MKPLYTFFENNEKESCCGCGLCANSCPVKAITMERDDKGFLYPSINEDSCIKCGLCRKKCAFVRVSVPPRQRLESYVCAANDEKVLRESSSGGIFTVITDIVLDAGGVVFASQYTDDFRVVVTKAYNSEERKKMLKAKYVQSELVTALQDIKTELESGRTVSFTGTPCQCDAVKHFIGDNENLILIDFICHGVPSPKVFSDYISDLEDTFGKKICDFRFRSKKFGGAHTQYAEAEFNNGTEYIMFPSIDVYYKAFLDNKLSRESCFICPYTSTGRVSDITIADAWGDLQKELDSPYGISTVLVNSAKGEVLFKKANCIKKRVSLEGRLQPQLKRPAAKPQDYSEWWQRYFCNGITELNNRSLKGKKRVIRKVLILTEVICSKIGARKPIENIFHLIWK